jgi:hypothetical protein
MPGTKPPVAGVAQIVAKMVIDSAVNAVVQWFQRTHGPPLTVTDANNVASGTAANWNTRLAPQFLPNVVLVEVECTDLTSPTAGQGFWSGSHAGSDVGTTNERSSCLIVSEEFFRRYRGGHPRKYWPGGAATHLSTGGNWTSTFTAGWANQWGLFVTDQEAIAITGGTMGNFVNVSYFSGFTNHTFPSGRVRPIPNLRTTPVVDDVVSFIIQPDVGSQRRRTAYLAAG